MICRVLTVDVPGPSGFLSDGGSSIVNAVFGGFCAWVAGGAHHMIDAVSGAIHEANLGSVVGPEPALSGGWFSQEMHVMIPIAGLIVVPLLAVATIGAVLHQDSRRLSRIWGVGLPVGVIGGFAAAALASEAMRVTDALCSAVSAGLGTHLDQVLVNLGTSFDQLVRIQPFVTLLAAVVALIGAVMLWLELLLRASAIELAVFFFPISLAGLVWPASAHWAKRHVEMLVALILSKFVIVGALDLAVGAIGNQSKGAPDPGTTMTGAAILVLAAFAPFVLLRFAPIVEAAALSHLDGLTHRGIGNASRLPANPAVSAAMSALNKRRGGGTTATVPGSAGAGAGAAAVAVGAVGVAARAGGELGDLSSGSGGAGSNGSAGPGGGGPGGGGPGGGGSGGGGRGGGGSGGGGGGGSDGPEGPLFGGGPRVGGGPRRPRGGPGGPASSGGSGGGNLRGSGTGSSGSSGGAGGAPQSAGPLGDGVDVPPSPSKQAGAGRGNSNGSGSRGPSAQRSSGQRSSPPDASGPFGDVPVTPPPAGPSHRSPDSRTSPKPPPERNNDDG